MTMALSSTSTPGAERAGAGAALLQLENVAKRYNGKVAIHVDRLQIAEGDAINFIGANASGKSTLLRIIAGVTRPSYGRVRRTPGARHLRPVLVPQSGGLYPSLTLIENMEAIARLFGVALPADDRAIPGLFELGLHELVDRRIGELSGGYRRLAAIATAMAMAPGGLLLDEPFAGLDPQKSEQLRKFLAVARPNMSFVAITGHESEAAGPGFGRTLRCADGKLLEGAA